ncbi:Protein DETOXIFICATION 14 [Fusarium oxysporum f. sp. albedinis]|nr:Protein DETOXIFICATION 14 [Fusarium oxysporum f. sp. albedinis]
MSMYISNGGPEADWEVYATTENVTHSKLARRATYNHNTYLTTPLFSATFAATRRTQVLERTSRRYKVSKALRLRQDQGIYTRFTLNI